MQKTLSIKVNKKTIVSKPWDFKTACIINDAHNDPTKRGPLNICSDTLYYIFEGTEATQDVIDKLDVAIRTNLCLKENR